LILRRIIAFGIAAAGLWFAWGALFPDDEAKVRAVLGRITEGVEDLAGIARLQEEFTVGAVVDAGPPFDRLEGRQPIVATAARVRAAIPRLELRFPETAIAFDDDRQSATAAVVAEARFDRRDGTTGFEARELEIRFVRDDGRWKISAVTLVQPLQRLDTR
jgi:hypothetical protein